MLHNGALFSDISDFKRFNSMSYFNMRSIFYWGDVKLMAKARTRPLFVDWQLRSFTVPACESLSVSRPGAMASGEEDGALEEKETNNKKRTKSIIATAWLMFYNIAMTAGYVRIILSVYFIVKAVFSAVVRSTSQCKLAVAVYSFRICFVVTVYGQPQ